MFCLEDSIRIEAPPEVVFGQLKTFLTDTVHFKEWHPEHEAIEWASGEPLTPGAICHADEFLEGRLRRLHFVFVSVVENRHLEYRPPWPLSLLVPGHAFHLEPLDEGRATLLKCSDLLDLSERLLLKLQRDRAARLEATRRHLHEEGMALKAAAEAAVG